MSETPSPPADPAAAATVWYDGGCPVCRREIGWYRAMRGGEAIGWVDVAHAPAEALPPDRDRAALLRRFTVIRADGRIETGARGFAALWRALGPTRALGRLTDREPFATLGEALYRLFLHLRRFWR